MSRPSVSATCELQYARLPAVYRAADAAQADGPNGYPLLRFLSLMVDHGLADVEALLDDLLPQVQSPAPFLPRGSNLAGDGLAGDGLAGGDDNIGPADVAQTTRLVDGVSALGDPSTAHPEWLAWLGQFVGVRFAAWVPEASRRAAIAAGSTGWRAGTQDSIQAAAGSALTGSKYLRIVPQKQAAGGVAVAGTLWDLLLVTRASETADPAEVSAAVIAAGAKPAGVLLWVLAYTATWGQMTTAYPTWADRNGLTWQQLEEAGAGT